MVLGRVDSIDADDVGPQLLEVGDITFATRNIRQGISVVSVVRLTGTSGSSSIVVLWMIVSFKSWKSWKGFIVQYPYPGRQCHGCN